MRRTPQPSQSAPKVILTTAAKYCLTANPIVIIFVTVIVVLGSSQSVAICTRTAMTASSFDRFFPLAFAGRVGQPPYKISPR